MALQSRWLLVALVAFLFLTAAVAGTKKPKEPKAPKAPKPPKAPKVPKELKEPKAAKEPKAPKAPKEKGGKTKDVPVFNNVTLPPANPGGVTYDGRSLIIKGSRDVLFSGSIHYPRFTPDMWPDILDKARHGGLNTISTYIFWNAHEPVPGKFNFEGNLDVIKFIRLIGEKGMYCVLRVGPYIEAEWTNGGLPYWIREVPGMVSRTDNGPFKMHMEKYVRKIIDMMKAAKLFIHQGGPIILAQIENEYSSVKGTTKEHGKRYIQWAGNMALATGAGVPWIMCKDEDAPSTVINTCNGRHCGDTFNGPNSPNKPSLWTENWTAQYRVWGNGPSQRAAEDLARSVTRFFSKDGTSTNYYMYYGGTNFGRSASEFTTTRYYDEAPLDEYGLQRGPKWYHLRDMHTALRMCKQALLFGTPSVQRISDHVEIRWYENREKNLCTAFFANNDTVNPATVKFQGKTFKVPTFSISILPDCKNVVLNTAEVISQHNSRNFVRSKVANKNLKWETSYEIIPTVQPPLKPLRDLEHFFLSKDTTDYVWYTTTVELNKFDLPMRKDIVPVLSITSHGHALLAFVNGEYVGTGHGEFRAQKFVFNGNVRSLKPGLNHIAILSIITGYPKSGAYMERKVAGPAHTRAGSISILGLNAGTIDLTNRPWGHQVGLSGEKIPVFTLAGSYRVKWTPNAKPRALSWYRAYFDAPEGRDPVALNLSSMSKGMVWVNGVSIGRYWVSYLSEQGKPTQSEYHIPRAFIKPTKNLLVVMDEEGKTPEKIEVMTVNRDTICSIIGEEFAPPLKASWEEGKDGKLKKIGDATPKVILGCPNYKKIVAVEFASYGTPEGTCGSLAPGKCNLNVKQMVEKACLGKTNCEIPVFKGAFGQPKGSCTAGPKTLAVQVLCAFGGGKQ